MLGGRRHWNVTLAHALDYPVSLIIPKEEYAVTFNGAAQRATVLVLVVGAALIVGIEVVRGIEVCVAKKLEHVPMETIGSGLGNYVDLAATVIAIFGIEVVGQDTEFRDGIEVRDYRSAAEARLLNRGSIQHESVIGFPHAVYRKPSRIQVARHQRHHYSGRVEGTGQSTRHSGRTRHNARLQSQQIRVAAADQRHIGHFLTANDLAQLRAAGFNAQRFS